MKNIFAQKISVWLFTSLIIISLLISCNNRKQGRIHPGITDIINLKNATNYASIDLSEIIKNVQCIPLNADTGFLIQEIDKILEYKNNFFILDRYQSQGVFVFDHNGRCLYKINSIGSAPGSIMYPLDIQIDSTKDELIVLDNDNRRINFYDVNTGKFKYSLLNKIAATRFKKIQSGGWWFTGGKSQSDITLMDDNLNSLIEFMDKEPGRPKMIYQSFLSVGDTLDEFILNYCDTIFRLDGDKIFAYKKIQFNQKDLAKTDTPYNYPDVVKAFPERKFLYKYYFENSSHIFFTYIQRSKLTAVVYNKESGKIITFPAENSTSNALFFNSFPIINSVSNDGRFIAVGDGDNFASIANDTVANTFFDLFSNKDSFIKNIHTVNAGFKQNPVIIKFDFE